MEYKEKCGRPWPGHVVFLIDQSGSMSEEIDGTTRLNLAQECVTNSIKDIVFGCLDNGKFHDRCYITIIGYGRTSDSVELLRKGWASEWEDDVIINRHNGIPLFTLECTDGWTPMAGAFEMAKLQLTEWHQLIANEIAEPHLRPEDSPTGVPITAMGLPVVINITDGCKDDFNQVEGYIDEVKRSAMDLMNTYNDDGGTVYLFNAHIGDGKELRFPKETNVLAGNPETEFLFEISSPLSAFLARSASGVFLSDGLIEIETGSKGLVVNSSKTTVTRFVTWGSNV